MKRGSTLFLRTLLFATVFIASAQNQYSIPACTSRDGKNLVGDRLRLQLPKGAIVKKGRDVDYSDYAIGFGTKSRTWLEGIYGPMATSGEVPDNWLSASSEVSRTTWTSGNARGIDWKGKLPNGNHWRYFGRIGESVKYYDVPSDAASYFDSILNGVCFREWR
jgi:hypothetical protein